MSVRDSHASVRPVVADRYSTFVDTLRDRAQHSPDAYAYTYLLDGDEHELHLTFGQLDEKARAIAVHLESSCAPGDRALLAHGPGLEFIAAFYGCLYAGVIAVPAYPPDPGRMKKTGPRLAAIVKDAEPSVILVDGDVMKDRDTIKSMDPNKDDELWIDTGEVDLGLASRWTPGPVTGETLAFLQYTSGSTGDPKGVMVTHENMLDNSRVVQASHQTSRETVIASWIPHFHDMGLIGVVSQTVYCGGRAVFMAPLSFIQRPLRWLTMITRYGGTTSFFPNFAMDYCVNKIKPEPRDALDLSTWRVACSGSEPIFSRSLERFAEYFAPAGFKASALCAVYGLAESTCFSTFSAFGEGLQPLCVDSEALEQHRAIEAAPNSEGVRRVVESGFAVGENQALVVDPETSEPCPPNTVGEVWISGPSVAQGYWNRLEDSEETFGARLAGGDKAYLRTGDFGFVHEGEIYVTGRIKDLIIVDGVNHYPQDIESTVEKCHAAIRPGCSTAFSIVEDGAERVVVVAEVAPDEGTTSREVGTAVRRAVSGYHDLRVHDTVFLKRGSLLKTSSGKLQRQGSKAEYLSNTMDVEEF